MKIKYYYLKSAHHQNNWLKFTCYYLKYPHEQKHIYMWFWNPMSIRLCLIGVTVLKCFVWHML